MELKREDIVKALEYCFGDKPCNKCEWHEVGNGCMSKLEQSAISLINELTEENERLTGTLEEVTKRIDNLIEKTPIAFDYERAQAKVDALRELQIRLTREIGTYLSISIMKVEDMFNLIDQIAEEILGGDTND